MPAYWDIQSKYRASFERHASPEAIASALKGAQAEQRRVARVIAWLEELHAKRADEKARGIWPYQDEDEAAVQIGGAVQSSVLERRKNGPESMRGRYALSDTPPADFLDDERAEG